MTLFVSNPPHPNPKVIAWAIEQSGFNQAQVAKHLQVKVAQVQAWQEGKVPTLRQLRNLALFVRRPLSLFYQAEQPQEKPLAAEYRRLPGVDPGAESPEFRRAIRDMLARRDWVEGLMEELDHELPDFTLTAHLDGDPREAGRRLREQIGISDQAQLGWRDKWQAWREWRSALEELGVLVFMFPDVKLAEARGVALFRMTLPVVGINTKEIPESRAYTALHEVVHLMLANGNEESVALHENRSSSEFVKLERFAEIAASYALVSDEAFRSAVGEDPPRSLAAIQQLAGKFKISPLSAATRLRESGAMTWDEYNAWKVKWNDYISSLPKAKGFATPVSKTLGRGGAMFAQLVFEALDYNAITMTEAAKALKLRTDQFDQLRERLVKGAAAEVPDE